MCDDYKSPVEALQAEIDRNRSVFNGTGSNPIAVRKWNIHIAALELAKADAELTHHANFARGDSVTINTQAFLLIKARDSARAKLYEALQQ